MVHLTLPHLKSASSAIRLMVMMCLAAIMLITVGIAQPAAAAVKIDKSQMLFCSHASKSGSVKNINTFTANGADQSKIVDATAMINAIVKEIGSMKAWKKTFDAIVANQSFKGAVFGAMLLYIVIFGIMIVFGMVNITWYEVFIRILKIGIVSYLLFGTGMSDIVARFIMGGMNELIDAYYDATIGTYPTTIVQPSGNVELTVKPLMFLIAPMEKVMNLQLICATLALMIAGPAGMGLAMFMLYALFNFFLAVIGALATYIKAVIGLTILFSIAPIFIACLLFEQTRRLFNGWLSMCISFALQPVFIFAFLGFFMVMMDGALQPLTNIHWCYGPVLDLEVLKIDFYYPVPPEYFGSKYIPQTLEVWKDPGGTSRATEYMKVPLDARYGIMVKDLWRAAGVDIYVVDVLMFGLLSQLCWRYSEYTGQIAREIVGGGVSISVGGESIMNNLKERGLDPQSLGSSAMGGMKNVGSELTKAFNNMGSGQGKENLTTAMRQAAKDFERK